MPRSIRGLERDRRRFRRQTARSRGRPSPSAGVRLAGEGGRKRAPRRPPPSAEGARRRAAFGGRGVRRGNATRVASLARRGPNGRAFARGRGRRPSGGSVYQRTNGVGSLAAEALDAYLEAAALEDARAALFQSVDRAGERLTGRPLTRRVVLAMIKRRAAAAELPPSTCCHTFRATGDHGVSVERRDPGARSADRRARVAEDDEALRLDGFGAAARASWASSRPSRGPAAAPRRAAWPARRRSRTAPDKVVAAPATKAAGRAAPRTRKERPSVFGIGKRASWMRRLMGLVSGHLQMRVGRRFVAGGRPARPGAATAPRSPTGTSVTSGPQPPGTVYETTGSRGSHSNGLGRESGRHHRRSHTAVTRNLEANG